MINKLSLKHFKWEKKGSKNSHTLSVSYHHEKSEMQTILDCLDISSYSSLSKSVDLVKIVLSLIIIIMLFQPLHHQLLINLNHDCVSL